jgi:hypothetical protein
MFVVSRELGLAPQKLFRVHLRRVVIPKDNEAWKTGRNSNLNVLVSEVWSQHALSPSITVFLICASALANAET